MERGGLLGSDEWIRNRDRLAEALEDENSWLLLTAFYYSLGRLRARALSATAGVSLAAAERKCLETMRDQATALYAVLWGHIPLPDNWQEQLRNEPGGSSSKLLLVSSDVAGRFRRPRCRPVQE